MGAVYPSSCTRPLLHTLSRTSCPASWHLVAVRRPPWASSLSQWDGVAPPVVSWWRVGAVVWLQGYSTHRSGVPDGCVGSACTAAASSFLASSLRRMLLASSFRRMRGGIMAAGRTVVGATIGRPIGASPTAACGRRHGDARVRHTTYGCHLPEQGRGTGRLAQRGRRTSGEPASWRHLGRRTRWT